MVGVVIILAVFYCSSFKRESERVSMGNHSIPLDITASQILFGNTYVLLLCFLPFSGFGICLRGIVRLESVLSALWVSVVGGDQPSFTLLRC